MTIFKQAENFGSESQSECTTNQSVEILSLIVEISGFIMVLRLSINSFSDVESNQCQTFPLRLAEIDDLICKKSLLKNLKMSF